MAGRGAGDDRRLSRRGRRLRGGPHGGLPRPSAGSPCDRAGAGAGLLVADAADRDPRCRAAAPAADSVRHRLLDPVFRRLRLVRGRAGGLARRRQHRRHDRGARGPRAPHPRRRAARRRLLHRPRHRHPDDSRRAHDGRPEFEPGHLGSRSRRRPRADAGHARCRRARRMAGAARHRRLVRRETHERADDHDSGHLADLRRRARLDAGV